MNHESSHVEVNVAGIVAVDPNSTEPREDLGDMVIVSIREESVALTPANARELARNIIEAADHAGRAKA